MMSRDFERTKGRLLAIGSFLAVGGLIVESLDTTIERQHDANEALKALVSDRYLISGVLEEGVSVTERCNPTNIVTEVISFSTDVDTGTDQVAERTIRCAIQARAQIVETKILGVVNNPEILVDSDKTLDRDEGFWLEFEEKLDQFIRDIEVDIAWIDRATRMLTNQSKPLTVNTNMDRFRQDMIAVRDGEARFDAEKRAADQVKPVRGVIFAGVGIDFVALFVSLILKVLIFLRAKIFGAVMREAESEEVRDTTSNETLKPMD